MGYIEQWGSGVIRIKNLCLQAGLREPIIQEKGNFVDVELFRTLTNENELSASPTQKTSVKIIDYIKSNNFITIPELSELIGVSERSIERNIDKLKKEGKLNRIGADKGGYWEVRNFQKV